MEKFQYMKAFIATTREHAHHSSEKKTSSIQRHLQILGVTEDLSIFDPGTSVAGEFYVCLHELMSGLDSKNALTWCCISVLEHTCKNPSARYALIHTYKFTQILSGLLEDMLNLGKTLKVLHILQELTYGVRIAWQEAHLPSLIKMLTQCVIKGDDKELMKLSLGILVNLCYKNLPAVYTFMHSGDSKNFFRALTNLQSDSATRVQVCKFLIIMDYIRGEIAEEDILNFVGVIFSTMGDMFKMKDISLLRHSVDFFIDIRTSPHYCKALLKYPSFEHDTSSLLGLIDRTSSPECMGLLLEFLHHLTMLNVPSLASLHLPFVQLSLDWINNEAACTQSLGLLRTVMLSLATEDQVTNGDSVLTVLQQNLSVFLMILQPVREANFRPTAEMQGRFTALFELLQEMSRTTSLCDKILISLDLEVVRKMFQPLLSAEQGQEHNLFQKESTVLYTHMLTLTTSLAQLNGHWLRLHSDLLDCRRVQMVLAMALYTGSEDIKRQVLTINSSRAFTPASVALLAKSLSDLEPMVTISASEQGAAVRNVWMDHAPQDSLMPYTHTHEGQLDHFIEKLTQMEDRGEIHNMSTSAVMELYEYKLAMMCRSERGLQSSLEAAGKYGTQLQHKVAQMSTEVSRLHQLLYNTQQCFEGQQVQTSLLKNQLAETEATANQAHNSIMLKLKKKLKQNEDLQRSVENLHQNMASSQMLIEAAELRQTNLEQKLAESQANITALEAKTTDQHSKLIDMSTSISKLENRVAKRTQLITEKDAEITSLLKQNQVLKGDVANFDLICKEQERNLNEKSEELNTTMTKLNELQRIRDVIFQISGGQTDLRDKTIQK